MLTKLKDELRAALRSTDDERRAELVTKMNDGDDARRRQAEIIGELERMFGHRFSVQDLARLRGGLALDAERREADQDTIALICEFNGLEDRVHEGMIAARDLRDNPPDWINERRRELCALVKDCERRIELARRELSHLADEVLAAEPQAWSDSAAD